jgi:hypothetical protein
MGTDRDKMRAPVPERINPRNCPKFLSSLCGCLLIKIGPDHVQAGPRHRVMLGASVAEPPPVNQSDCLISVPDCPAFAAARHPCFSSRRDRGSTARSGPRHPKTR